QFRTRRVTLPCSPYAPPPYPALHSFPTRRSSDLTVIPTPRSILGFDPGDDRKLVEWPVLERYYEALAKASDRVDYREIGKTTLGDRKSTRLNSSHGSISYAVFCLKKKNKRSLLRE